MFSFHLYSYSFIVYLSVVYLRLYSFMVYGLFLCIFVLNSQVLVKNDHNKDVGSCVFKFLCT